MKYFCLLILDFFQEQAQETTNIQLELPRDQRTELEHDKGGASYIPTVELTKIKNRPHTLVHKLDYKVANQPDEKSLMTFLKKKVCNSGGHIQRDDDDYPLYVIQGDFRNEIIAYLKKKLHIKDVISAGTT